MTDTPEIQLPEDKPLEIAGRIYQSRLLVGTGKYRDLMETGHAIEMSGADIVTVAVRRTNLGQNPDEPNLLDVISPEHYTDRKSTRLNSSHVRISYAVFCLKKKKKKQMRYYSR